MSRDQGRQPPPGARIDIPSVPNLRDIGGYRTRDGGRVRMGQLYRSVELDWLGGDDLDAFARLGIRSVFDLRNADAHETQPDVLPDGTELIACDVLADSTDAAPGQLMRAIADPSSAERMFGEDRAVEVFEQGYREIVSLPSALRGYSRLFTMISEDVHRPALFHCTTGKDRTGWAAAAALLILGVDEDDVYYDYELTNRDLLPAMKPVMEHFRAAGGNPEVLEPVLGVDPRYLETALDEMRSEFGSVEGYFADGLGIGEEGQRRLREALVER